MATQIRVVAQDDGRVVYLDLEDSQPITANYQFKDIQDFKSTKGDHTYNFRVPSTYNNNLFFNQYFEVTQHGNFNPKLKVEATILKDTLPVFGGYLQLTNVIALNDTDYSYECVVFSAVGTIGQVLEGKYLNQFDWSDYTHAMSRDNVIDSFDQNLLDGDVVYSLYDYGSAFYGGEAEGSVFDINSPIDVRSLRPQIRVKAVLDVLLNQSGFNYTSDFFDTKELYVDANAGSGGVNAVNVNYYNVQFTINPLSLQTMYASNGFHHIILNGGGSSGTDYSNEAGLYNTTLGTYTMPSAPFDMVQSGCYVTIKGESSTSGDAPLTGASFQIHLIDSDDNVIRSGTLKTFTSAMQIPDGGGYYQEQAINCSSFNYAEFEAGVYKYVLEITNTDDASVEIEITDGEVKYTPLIGLPMLGWSASYYQADMTFDFGMNFPDIKAVDFLTSLAKKFNLIIVPDKVNPNYLSIEPYSDWIEEGNVLDWTDKLNVSKDIQYKPTADLQAKSLVFTDGESEDNMNALFKQSTGRIYGSQLIDNTSNDFGKNKEVVDTIFKPVVTTYIPNTGIRSCVCYTGENEDITNQPSMRLSYYSGLVESDVLTEQIYLQGVDGIVIMNQQISSFPLLQNYEDAEVTGQSECLTFAGESTGQLNVPTTLSGAFNTYWNPFIQETYSPEARIMTGTFFLSALDIMTMNFNDKIFVKNEYFRINKISGYSLVGSADCKVELVKVSKTNAVFDGNVCDVEPVYFSWTGFVVFANTESGALEFPSQECCEGYGYTYELGGCWETTTEPNNPTSPTLTTTGQTEFHPTKFSDGVHTTTRGIMNEASDFGFIVGTHNRVNRTSRSVSINGHRNDVEANVSGSSIVGNNNILNPYLLRHTGSEYEVYAHQEFQNVTMRGDYGIAIASGDNFVSTGADPLYDEVGRGGSGHFVRAFTTYQGTPAEVVYVGQNGAFTPSTGTPDEILANQTENFFRLPFPSMMTFEARIGAVNRGSVLDRSQLFSNRIYQGRINNTTDLLGVSSDLDNVSPKDNESGAFSPMKFEIHHGQGVMDGTTENDVLCDGMFAFKIDTSDCTTLDDTDFTIDIKYTLVGMQNMKRLASPIQYDPTDISDCKLWLDGSDLSTITESSGDVSQWDDKSGNGYNFTKPTEAGNPSLSTIGVLNCLDFDLAYDDALYNTSSGLYLIPWLGNSTWFVVFESDTDTASTYGNQLVGSSYTLGNMFSGINLNSTIFSSGGADTMAFWNDNNDFSAYVDDIPVTQVQVACGYRDGTTQAIIDQDGNTTSNTSASGVFANQTFVGGAVKSSNGKIQNPYGGKVGEVLLYNRKLTTSEIDEVMNYLKTKWNT